MSVGLSFHGWYLLFPPKSLLFQPRQFKQEEGEILQTLVQHFLWLKALSVFERTGSSGGPWPKKVIYLTAGLDRIPTEWKSIQLLFPFPLPQSFVVVVGRLCQDIL